MRERNTPLQLLTLLVLILLASACTTQPEPWQAEQVAPPAIPPLPNEARQPPAPQWCSQTCSSGLTSERESWQKLMTQPE
jgi:predicted nucleic acid-binding Zn ribbon protein